MATSFDEIIIIYNPNSTGDSEKNARDFADELKTRMPKQTLTIRATKRAGHAQQMAKEYAASKRSVLIVSSSGDGGYNEVVNGAVSRGTSNVATAVLPSGNANDHYNSVSSDDLIGNIVNGNITTIELIKVVSKVDGKTWTKYAHSYVGFGLTPKIGRELTARRLNAFNEKWHTLYHLLKFKHTDLTKQKKVRRYSSLVFATVSRMSKVIKLSETASPNDGLMEVYETEYRSPWQLIKTLVRASVHGLSQSSRHKTYELRTLRKTLVQLDGEVFTIDADAGITITCEKDALRTIV